MSNESRYKSIEELQKKRNVFVAEAKEQGMFEGIKSTLTKLYTSSGHFIFELLQNAEDAKATSVSFKLYPDKLVFEHNGSKLFNLNDIDSITNYGDSTKKENGNSIGKFGIGFKSVFEYTNSPEIHSGDYNFAIEDLFIPKVITPLINYDKNSTLIIIPFNCQKDIKKCYSEIRESIEELKADVLLFLQNIAEINCIIDSRRIIIKRIDSYSEDNCPDNVCKLSRKTKDGNVVVVDKNAPKGQSIYKRFFKKVRILDEDKNEKEITICIAFLMDYIKDENKWKIKPIFREGTDIPDGRIFAYFPCDAEERRFCFHIHAPFALKPDREKLRDEDANKIVIEELGLLLCESMKELKQDGLVDLELYKTLPNLNDDNLGWFEIIRAKIINFYLNNPYILMSDGTYQNGKNKFIGFHNIQKLLSNEDLSILYNTPKQSYWVKNPMQNRRDYNFLISLQVREYTIVDFIKTMIEIKNGPEEFRDIIKLFESRDSEWFVRLYSLMNIGWNAILRNQIQDIIPSLQLCFCNDKRLYKFNNCYLNDSISDMSTSDIHCVNSECLNSKQTDTDLLYFLKNRLGLKEYNISDMIDILCEDFEKKPNKTLDDTITFYKMYLQDDSIVDVLSKHKILCSDDGIWDLPEWFYLPEEYGYSVDNISIYYDFYNSKINNEESNSITRFYYSRKPKEHLFYKLNVDYKSYFSTDKEISDFIVFLREMIVQKSLVVWESSCKKNPIWRHIQESSESSGGAAIPTDEDFEVKYFDAFLKRPPNEAVFELIWSFLLNTPSKWRNCKYSSALKNPVRYFPSHITVDLCNNDWVLQVNEDKVYFVKPEEAFLSRLPVQYRKQIENSSIREWLSAVGFGKKERQQSEQQKKENEILSAIGLDIGFVNIIRDLQSSGVSKSDLEDYMQALKDDLQTRIADGFFSNSQIDEERIRNKTSGNFNEADDIEYEQRNRNVRIGNRQKDLAEQFLRSNCIDEDNTVHCQLCRCSMPFKDKNDKDYFEVVQLFGKELIQKEVYQNYVALCPICSAKMKVYYQHDKDKKKDLFKRIGYSQNHVKAFKLLLDKEEELLFSDRHIIELRQIIEEAKNSQQNISIENDINKNLVSHNSSIDEIEDDDSEPEIDNLINSLLNDYKNKTITNKSSFTNLQQYNRESSDLYIQKEVDKVTSRLPKWFNNTWQYNSKVLYAFLRLYNPSIGYVSYTALRNEADIGSAFTTNYNQMKIIAEKNHGKVFEQVGDRVYLWENVKDIVLRMYETYK
ncbi:MAG: hypothetical protein IIX56_03960 [Treponema sp.]|nr:hypothetical protein [Treponema sp.]